MANLVATQLQHLIDNAGVSSVFKIDDTIDGEKYSIKVQKHPENEEELNKLYGIDVDAMMRNVLVNECFAALSKFLMKNIEDAEETDNFNHNFIITGSRVASCLQEEETYKSRESDDKLSITAGLYNAGTINETQLIVDPYISWSQTHALAFDIEHPITCTVEEDNTDEYNGLTVKIKVADNLKCYVWNCPEEILDRM